MNKNESIINGACLLFRLLRKGDAWVSNTLVFKHRQPETSNQTIQLYWPFFQKNVEWDLEGTKTY